MKKVKLKCKDCKKVFEVDADKPLSEVVPGHTWLAGTTHGLRHLNDDDWFEEQAEREAEILERRHAEGI